MSNRVSYIFLGAAIIATILACGKRGSLYLQDSDAEQTQPGHELTQDSDATNQKKKAAARKDN